MPKGGKKGGGAEASKLMKRRSASYEELQALDWSAVQNSTKVKYDPNRLIFGATEDGFMELEEIDMEEVNAMVGVTGGGGAFNAKDSSPSTPEDDAEPTKKPRKKEKGDAGAKKAAEEKQQSAAASLRRRSASFEELQAVDWNAVTKSTPVKYDPNRLIFGATEDGFMELEEIDMEEVNAMAIGGAAAASGGQRDVHAGSGSDDDDEGADADGAPMSAKEARIAKRKARWKAKVEAAKQRKAEARARAADAPAPDAAKKSATDKADKSSIRDDADERYLSNDDDDDDSASDDDGDDRTKPDATPAAAPTAEAQGDAKAQGWQMDYNNYPTSGMGAVVDGVDLDAGADVSNWLQFDLHP